MASAIIEGRDLANGSGELEAVKAAYKPVRHGLGNGGNLKNGG